MRRVSPRFEIMIKLRGHSMHTGHGIEPTVIDAKQELVSILDI